MSRSLKLVLCALAVSIATKSAALIAARPTRARFWPPRSKLETARAACRGSR